MSMKTRVLVLLASVTLLACNREAPRDVTPAAEPPAMESAPAQAEMPVETPESAPQSDQDAIPQSDQGHAPQSAQSDVSNGQGDPCNGMDTQLTSARKHEYAGLVSGAMDRKVRPGKVDVSMFTGSEAWSMVLASTPIADPGYFFFESVDGRKVFKDVWAGVAEQDDVPGVVQWVQGLGAPESFAKCFGTLIAIVD